MTITNRKSLQEQIDQLPEKTGVYIFKGRNKTVYIGKATNIKKRVVNHFQNSKYNQRESLIIKSIEKMEYILTNTETDALIEENILIKTYKPMYNVHLSDDKAYPYLKIDIASEYPCINVVRRISNDNAKYFGPYSDVAAMRSSLQFLRDLFPIRTCKKDLNKIRRSCLYYHIHRCCAPCLGNISKQEYAKIVNQLILFLEGKQNIIINNLQSDMTAASQKQEYEKAAYLRDKIADLEKVTREIKVVLPSDRYLDAIVLCRRKIGTCVQVLQIREGKLLSSESFDLKEADQASDQEALESFLKQYYMKRTYIPTTLLINKKISDSTIIANLLSIRCGKSIEIKKPSDEKFKGLLDIGLLNASAHLDQLTKVKQKLQDSLEQLKKDMGLMDIPRLIECYDISNLGSKQAVGAKILFQDGRPNKKMYRMFKIKTISGQDDQAMMGEVIQRRFKRLIEEDTTPPDLVVVDGGITQVKKAKNELDTLSLSIPVIGLAKKWERIYFPDGNILELSNRSKSKLLLQQIRDETHRFALQYHRKRREKNQISP